MFDREKVNEVFYKLQIIAGGSPRESRRTVWSTISKLKREKGRTPTLGEVLDSLTQSERHHSAS
ncbi:MAG: hypothetical protein ACYCY6_02525 [Minisyncoccota bacterium]